MKKLIQYFSLVIIIASTALLSSCNQDAAPSLYVEENPGATPVITSIAPDKEALAGVTEITINGSNFSSVKDYNFVYFGTAKATVLQASSTQLVVKAPAKIANNLDIKIAVQGVENFSNIVKYNLLEAVGIYYAFAKNVDIPMTVATDKNENVYVYLNNKGIKKITPDGAISDYAPKGAESFFFDMKFGPNNILYGTRNLRAIFQVEAGKTSATYVVLKTGVSIVAIDLDKDYNMWAAGSGGLLYRIKNSTKDTLSKRIDYSASAVRVYNGYLYVAGKNATEEAIYKYKINSDASLGNQEKYFDIGVKYGLGKVNVGSLAFSVDGELILGTDQTDALILVNAAGSASTLYPGLLAPTARSIAWSTKKNLFYVRDFLETTGQVNSLIRVDMQKLSAPYYGIQ